MVDVSIDADVSIAVDVDVDAVEVRVTRRVVWVRSVDPYNVRVVAGHVAVDVDVDAVEVRVTRRLVWLSLTADVFTPSCPHDSNLSTTWAHRT